MLVFFEILRVSARTELDVSGLENVFLVSESSVQSENCDCFPGSNPDAGTSNSSAFHKHASKLACEIAYSVGVAIIAKIAVFFGYFGVFNFG